MAELGLVLSTVPIAELLLKAIRGLRTVYHATNDAPHVLSRLEKDAATIKFYLHFVDEAITRSEFPDSFITWFENEKELLGHATLRIEEYAKTIENRLKNSRLVSAVQHALDHDVTEISKVQEQLASSISTIGHMMAICRHDSFDSRAAALRAEKSERLRAQTESSIAECREESLGSCNACCSLDDSGGASSEHPQPYQEVLKRSRPYMRAATRSFFGLGVGGAGPSSSKVTVEDQSQLPLDPGAQDLGSRISPAVGSHSQSSGQGDSPDHGAQSQREDLSAGLIPPQLSAFSTQSSSSHRPGTSVIHSWSIPDQIPSLSTPLTTQTPGPATAHDAGYHRRYLPLRVEIDALGQLTVELDRLQPGDLYSNVKAAILMLRDRLMRSVGVIAVSTAMVSKEQGIIPYKAEDQRQSGSIMRLSRGYLAGAIEDLDTGFFSRLEIFALFALPQSENKEPQIADMILDSQRTTAERTKARDPAHFPTVESVLNLHDSAAIKRVTQAFNTATHRSSSWSLIWISGNFITPQSPWPDALLLGGPDWCEKQLVATGGSSDVYRVVLSPSQQLHFTNPGPFALKALRPGQEHLFVRELEAHMHFASTQQPHIVTLLMAYEQAGRFHFVFPWADGTLTTFFQCRALSPSAETIVWLLGQWVGLLEALESIHCISLSSEKDAVRVPGGGRYGSHGDIKPDNILWFQPLPQATWKEDYGTFVITDFGLTRLPRTEATLTSTMSRDQRGGTLAYAPPDSEHSPSYDVFSLGCVLLEVAAWMAGGPEAWKRFYSARFNDGNPLSYIANQDSSLHLHPSLSNPRSFLELLISEFRQGSDGQPLIHGDVKSFLGQWCDVVERCLELQAVNRPSASQLVDFLKRAGTEFQWPPSPSKPTNVGHIFLDAMEIEEGTSDELINEGPETQLEDHISAGDDTASLGLAPVIPTRAKLGDRIPGEPGKLGNASVTVEPTKIGQIPSSPYSGLSSPPELSCETPALGSGHQTVFSVQPLTKSDSTRDSPHRDTLACPIESQFPTITFSNWHFDTSTAALGRGPTVPTVSHSSPKLYSGMLRQLGLLLPRDREEACWRCRNSHTKCEGRAATPCARCLGSLGNVSIPCHRGTVCDLAAEIPFLCHIPQSPGPCETTTLPPALQPAAELLSDLKQRRLLTATRLKGREYEVGSNYRIFSKVLNTQVQDIRYFNPLEDVGVSSVEVPYDELIAYVVWEFEDNPEAAQLTGIESLEDLVSLLEAACLCESRYGHYDRKRRLVYSSIRCLLFCLYAIRLALRGLLTLDAHNYCSQATGCISPAFQGLFKHALQYAKVLDRALFSKRRERSWHLVFYSFCIQQHVRRGLMSLEKSLHSAGRTEHNGPEPPLRSANYLKTAVSIFEQISLQKDGRLAKRLRNEQPRPSEYIPQSPHISQPGDAPSSWRNWQEDISKSLERMFGPPTNPTAPGTSSSQSYFHSDARIAGPSPVTLTTLLEAPVSQELMGQEINCSSSHADEGLRAIPASKSERQASIMGSIDSRWTGTDLEDDHSGRWTFFSGSSVATTTSYAGSLRSTVFEVKDKVEGEDSWEI